MATATLIASAENVKKRCDELDYELVISDIGQQFVLGGEDGTDVVFSYRDEENDDLEQCLADEQASRGTAGNQPRAALASRE